jgi:hypothetical protein
MNSTLAVDSGSSRHQMRADSASIDPVDAQHEAAEHEQGHGDRLHRLDAPEHVTGVFPGQLAAQPDLQCRQAAGTLPGADALQGAADHPQVQHVAVRL